MEIWQLNCRHKIPHMSETEKELTSSACNRKLIIWNFLFYQNKDVSLSGLKSVHKWFKKLLSQLEKMTRYFPSLTFIPDKINAFLFFFLLTQLFSLHQLDTYVSSNNYPFNTNLHLCISKFGLHTFFKTSSFFSIPDTWWFTKNHVKSLRPLIDL